MDTEKLQALVWGPLETLAGMMESSEASAEDCAEVLRLTLVGLKARMEQDA